MNQTKKTIFQETNVKVSIEKKRLKLFFTLLLNKENFLQTRYYKKRKQKTFYKIVKNKKRQMTKNRKIEVKNEIKICNKIILIQKNVTVDS